MPAIVVDCADLAAEAGFFTREAGFRVCMVTPADDPRRMIIERDGTDVELRRADHDDPIRLRIDVPVEGPAGEIRSPAGSVVEFAPRSDEMVIPENRPSLTIVDADSGAFGVGRAGMEYRDLLPDRWGGRFIASHIRIEDGGEVADWVHFHRIRFQMIFVAAGWVEVVYEDQGEPFRMVAGDCVLQPPEIRHRVLRSSPGLEVIEVGCPAEHDTLADHDLDLPTSAIDRDREFGGQRFVRHIAEGSPTAPWVDPSLTARDTGIGRATDQLADALVLSAVAPASGAELVHDGEFLLLVGLEGDATLNVADREVALSRRTSVAVPAGTTWRWSQQSDDHRVLAVSLPAGSVHRY